MLTSQATSPLTDQSDKKMTDELLNTIQSKKHPASRMCGN